jgi:hypothetical protein
MARRSGGKGRWGDEEGSGVTRQWPPEAARALRRPAADRGDGCSSARKVIVQRFTYGRGDVSVDFSEPVINDQFDGSSFLG